MLVHIKSRFSNFTCPVIFFLAINQVRIFPPLFLSLSLSLSLSVSVSVSLSLSRSPSLIYLIGGTDKKESQEEETEALRNWDRELLGVAAFW